MMPKHDARFYVESAPGGVWKLGQVSYPPTGYFMNEREARWICNRLNSGRELCIAVTNLMSGNPKWIHEEATTLIEDVLQALYRFKRDNF